MLKDLTLSILSILASLYVSDVLIYQFAEKSTTSVRTKWCRNIWRRKMRWKIISHATWNLETADALANNDWKVKGLSILNRARVAILCESRSASESDRIRFKAYLDQIKLLSSIATVRTLYRLRVNEILLQRLTGAISFARKCPRECRFFNERTLLEFALKRD